MTRRKVPMPNGQTTGNVPPTKPARKRRQKEPPSVPAQLATLSCPSAADLVGDGERKWLWDAHLFFGGVFALEGVKGGGKSTLLAALAADVTGGPRMDPGQRPRPPQTVLWFPGEENPFHDVTPRLRVAGADIARVRFPGYDEAGKLLHRIQLPAETGLLAELVREHRAALVVVDPWSSCLPAGASMTDPLTARQVMEALTHLGGEYHCCVTVSRNLRKDRTGDAMDHGLGSSEIAHVARALLQIREHPDREDWSVIAVAAINGAQKPTARAFSLESVGGPCKIHWQGEVGLSADDLADQDTSPSGRDERRDAIRLLEPITAGQIKRSKEVFVEALTAGISLRTLRRAKAELRIQSRRVAEQGVAFWVWEPLQVGESPREPS